VPNTRLDLWVVAVVGAKPGMSSKGTSCCVSICSRMPSRPVPGMIATCGVSGATCFRTPTASCTFS